MPCISLKWTRRKRKILHKRRVGLAERTTEAAMHLLTWTLLRSGWANTALIAVMALLPVVVLLR